MKNILCYGDSNTWGYNPIENGKRYEYKDRWTTILGNSLGSDYNIISEGLNGRTTVWDDPIKLCVNGQVYLLPCLESHKPLDLVIIMLGTNDLKQRLNLPACDIAAGAGVLVDIVQKSMCGVGDNSPEVLVLIPPEVRKLSNFSDQFGNCKEISKKLPEVFIKMTNEKDIFYLEIGKMVRFSDTDGIHYGKDQLPILAKIVKDKVDNILI